MTTPERTLEDQLKHENPKGKLLEWCARSRVESPVLIESTDGDQLVAELVLRVGEDELRSGPARAGAKKTAVQLAARELLRQLEAHAGSSEQGTVRVVSGSDAARLKARNAKGRLLERCAQDRLGAPSFEPLVRPGGHLRRGLLPLPDGALLRSSWYQADTVRDAEQAASDELLERLESWKHGSSTDDPLATADDSLLTVAPSSPIAGERTALVHPKSVLNHLQQTLLIDAFGFEPVGQKGSMHAPIFVVRGWFELDGARTAGPACEAPNKRDAEALAAAALLVVVEASDL